MGLRGPKPGRPRQGGRKKGTPNKITAQVKDAILEAFTIVGGEDYLVKVAKNDPRTFCTLLGKILPMQVEGDTQGSITYQIITGVPRPGDDDGPAIEASSSYTVEPNGKVIHHAIGGANGQAGGN